MEVKMSPKSNIRKSVNWVQSFRIQGIDGEADSLHRDLHSLEDFISDQLPFFDKDFSVEYQQKRTQLEQTVITHRNLFFIHLNTEKNCSEITNKIALLHICRDIGEFFEELEDASPNPDQQDEKVDLCKKLIALREDRDEDDISDHELDVDTIESEGIDETKYQKELKPLKKILETERDSCKKILHRMKELEGQIIQLKNEITRIKESCSKSLSEAELFRMTSTLTLNDYPPVKIDYDTNTVKKRADKDKKFSENLVFANLTFVLEIQGKKREISIPVKVPNQSVANLSLFKPADHMSLESENTRYDSSNSFLSSQIRRRFSKTAVKNGIDVPKNFDSSQLFSHSEQALFSALDCVGVRKLIAIKLKKELAKLNIDPSTSTVKINNIIIDLHTSRYMCDNCTISALGAQNNKTTYNSDDHLSLKNLVIASVAKEIADIKVASNCSIHTRASTGNDFETDKKDKKDHTEKVVLDSNKISQKDMRIDTNRKLIIFKSLYLSRKLTQYTLFTSGDTEEPKFKTAYARATSRIRRCSLKDPNNL